MHNRSCLGEAVKDGHMYGFKNWDFNQCARPHIVILDIQLKNGPHMIGFSEAGQIMRMDSVVMELRYWLIIFSLLMIMRDMVFR